MANTKGGSAGNESGLFRCYLANEAEIVLRAPQCHDMEAYEKERARVINVMISLQGHFQLSPHTLYVAVSIMDRVIPKLFPSVCEVMDLSVISVAALFLAYKHEGVKSITAITAKLLCTTSYITNITESELLDMERCIVRELKWDLTTTTPYMFLVSFINASNADVLMFNMVYFLAELGMMNLEVVTKFKPSVIAASTFCLAMHTLKRVPMWSAIMREKLLKMSVSDEDMNSCFDVLAGHHACSFQLAKDDSSYQEAAIWKKWSFICNTTPYSLQLEDDVSALHI